MPRNELEQQLEKAWIRIIAACIKDADRKGSLGKVIKSRRSRKEDLDWLEHRLEFSKTEPTIPRVIQRFANKLSLQAPDLPLSDIDFLREHEDEALDILRDNCKLLVLYSAAEAGFSTESKSKSKSKTKKEGGNQKCLDLIISKE